MKKLEEERNKININYFYFVFGFVVCLIFCEEISNCTGFSFCVASMPVKINNKLNKIKEELGEKNNNIITQTEQMKLGESLLNLF